MVAASDEGDVSISLKALDGCRSLCLGISFSAPHNALLWPDFNLLREFLCFSQIPLPVTSEIKDSHRLLTPTTNSLGVGT